MVARGDLLGRVHGFGGISPHLHLALVEIIGGAPGGQYIGVDLYQFFLGLQSADPETVVAIQFWQDGSAPEPIWRTARVGVVSAEIKGFAGAPYTFAASRIHVDAGNATG